MFAHGYLSGYEQPRACLYMFVSFRIISNLPEYIFTLKSLLRKGLIKKANGSPQKKDYLILFTEKNIIVCCEIYKELLFCIIINDEFQRTTKFLFERFFILDN